MAVPYWQVNVYLTDSNGLDVGSLSIFGYPGVAQDVPDTPNKYPAFSFYITNGNPLYQVDPGSVPYGLTPAPVLANNLSVNSPEFIAALETMLSGLDWSTLYSDNIASNHPSAVLPVTFGGITVVEVNIAGIDIYNTVPTAADPNPQSPPPPPPSSTSPSG